MKFNYQARNKEGEIQSGTIEASSKEGAVALLQKNKLFVTAIEDAGAAPFLTRNIKLFDFVSAKEVVIFSRQLAIMFKAKVPLVEALDVLAMQIKNRNLKEKVIKISEEVEAGTSFSQALAGFPNVFSPFYVSMVRSGEASGTLSESLSYLADHLEREYHLMSRLKGALIYPAIIVLMMIVIFLLITVFVVPQLTAVLEESGQELPFITKIVISLSKIIRTFGLGIFLGLLGIIAGLIYYLRGVEGKKFRDRALLRLPVMGNFLKIVYVSRFAENLGTLISGGIPISKSLEITAEIVGNSVYKTVIIETVDKVRKGESINSILSKYPDVFPPVFTQMVMVGEKTGALDITLLNVVEFYKKEVDREIENVFSLLEPVLIIFLGVVVGGLIGAVLLPLYQMTGV